ncbi:MAG: hypothetical protein K6G75_08230 [Lachnospiraceae bacterium]|nr:hypothetical protein [Lachnospiraceae bacterium]
MGWILGILALIIYLCYLVYQCAFYGVIGVILLAGFLLLLLGLIISKIAWLIKKAIERKRNRRK